MQEGKFVWLSKEASQIAEERREVKIRENGKAYPTKFTVPENSNER